MADIRKMSCNSYNLFLLCQSLDNQLFLSKLAIDHLHDFHFTASNFTIRIHSVSPFIFEFFNPNEV